MGLPAQKKPPLRFLGHNLQSPVNRPQHHGGQGGGVDERPGPVVEVVHQAPVPGHETSLGAQGLGKGAQVDVHFPGQAQGFGQPAALVAQDAGGVGLVHHEPGPVPRL